jgi:hypothetical protein
MSADLMVTGPVNGGTGTLKPFTGGITGAQRVSDAHGRYFEALRSGNAYGLSAAAGAPTAYVGAAGGTPLLAVHNPANSAKLLNVLAVGIAGRATASGAGTTGFALWAGASVIPTGTVTPARNMLSLVSGGSAGVGFVNAALTGSTALSLVLPLGSYYWATAAAAFITPLMFDIAGLVLIAPGNQVAFGATVALTSATYDVSMIWEELPFLV